MGRPVRQQHDPTSTSPTRQVVAERLEDKLRDRIDGHLDLIHTRWFGGERYGRGRFPSARLLPYKRLDLAVRAASQTGLRPRLLAVVLILERSAVDGWTVEPFFGPSVGWSSQLFGRVDARRPPSWGRKDFGTCFPGGCQMLRAVR